ncbi:MAG: 16S rRNA (cytosine(1402)-N(4))-methyltransferase RsmH, partial [Gammaproteobacteria bacterium]|nr:16S rRNA (cytosine(1402)-N(4))-methyltransferase RsmH [Gammaproteobacteria bacterium]
YVDATFGRGGHSGAILQQLEADGRLIAIDRDPQAIASAAATLTDDPRFELVRGEIAKLATYIDQRELRGQVDGVLFDLGVSSPQLDEAQRGFSFLRDGPLDMRMDPDAGRSAAEWLQSVGQRELRQVISKYGEERNAVQIARAIVGARETAPVQTTRELADLVESVVPRHGQRKHPATKTFQAIRIFINDELGQLQAALTQSVDVMKKGGRLCVISFHSLEDRIVKRFMRRHSLADPVWRGLPDIPEHARPRLGRPNKALRADDDEVTTNPRSRSATLRSAEVLR